MNIGYVSNETNADVGMYIEELILVEIWIHCCTNWKPATTHTEEESKVTAGTKDTEDDNGDDD